MLNYLPNVRLSGENFNELFVLSKLESNTLFPSGKLRLIDEPKDVRHRAFRHNGIPAQSMACQMQGVMGTLNPPPEEVQRNAGLNGHPSIEQYDQDMILGMKTIRYHKRHKMFVFKQGKWTIEESSSFLKNNFPCSKVLVNIRSDVKAQLSSRESLNWVKVNSTENQDKIVIKMQKDNAFLRSLALELGEDMAKIIDMTDWVDNTSVLYSVVNWLGFKDCNFTPIYENES